MTNTEESTSVLVRHLNLTVKVIRALLKSGGNAYDSAIKYKLAELEKLVLTIPEANSELLAEWEDNLIELWLANANGCSDEAANPATCESEADCGGQCYLHIPDDVRDWSATPPEETSPFPQKVEQAKAQPAKVVKINNPATNKKDDCGGRWTMQIPDDESDWSAPPLRNHETAQAFTINKPSLAMRPQNYYQDIN